MAVITGLFGESPFAILMAHSRKVHECVNLLGDLFKLVHQGNGAEIQKTAARIMSLETEADRLQNHLHEQLTSRILLPVGKEHLTRIAEAQDSMADYAEDIAAIFTYRTMPLPSELIEPMREYLGRSLNACRLASGIISKFDLLVESSFSGLDAVTVSKLITELSEREDVVKGEQFVICQTLFRAEDRLSPVDLLLWVQIAGFIAALAHSADSTGANVRIILKK